MFGFGRRREWVNSEICDLRDRIRTLEAERAKPGVQDDNVILLCKHSREVNRMYCQSFPTGLVFSGEEYPYAGVASVEREAKPGYVLWSYMGNVGKEQFLAYKSKGCANACHGPKVEVE